MIRELTADGQFVTDHDVSGLITGNLSMSGISFDNARGEVWISSRDGNVYRVGGFGAGGGSRTGVRSP